MNLEDVDIDDLIGAVKYKGQWRFFAGIVAEWVLDYERYEPGYDPVRDDTPFRNGLLVVNENNAGEFCNVMAPYELSPSDIEQLIKKEGANHFPLSIVIDFDAKVYINGFSEIPLHEYVPSNWVAKEDNSLKYLPDNFKALWTLASP
jgi:hypothetical protein